MWIYFGDVQNFPWFLMDLLQWTDENSDFLGKSWSGFQSGNFPLTASNFSSNSEAVVPNCADGNRRLTVLLASKQQTNLKKQNKSPENIINTADKKFPHKIMWSCIEFDTSTTSARCALFSMFQSTTGGWKRLVLILSPLVVVDSVLLHLFFVIIPPAQTYKNKSLMKLFCAAYEYERNEFVKLKNWNSYFVESPKQNRRMQVSIWKLQQKI